MLCAAVRVVSHRGSQVKAKKLKEFKDEREAVKKEANKLTEALAALKPIEVRLLQPSVLSVACCLAQTAWGVTEL